MNTVKLFLGLAFLSLLLPGCTRTVYSERVHYVTMNEAWLKDCPIASPPDMVEYSNANDKTRSLMWAKVYVSQLETQAKCWTNSQSARERNESFRKLNNAK